MSTSSLHSISLPHKTESKNCHHLQLYISFQKEQRDWYGTNQLYFHISQGSLSLGQLGQAKSSATRGMTKTCCAHQTIWIEEGGAIPGKGYWADMPVFAYQHLTMKSFLKFGSKDHCIRITRHAF